MHSWNLRGTLKLNNVEFGKVHECSTCGTVIHVTEARSYVTYLDGRPANGRVPVPETCEEAAAMSVLGS